MNFPQTLAIAQLCPYHGGAAVYTARFFVSFINDSMEYDDQTVCLQQGILRAINPLNIFANFTTTKSVFKGFLCCGETFGQTNTAFKTLETNKTN